MQLTIDISQPLTETEASVLRVLLNGGAPEEKQDPGPARKKSSAAKKRAEKKPEPEPEEDLKEQAVQRATALVSDGEADAVRAALKEAGAKRVSELEDDDDVRTFLNALPEED